MTTAASIVFSGALLCSHFDFHIAVQYPRLICFLSPPALQSAQKYEVLNSEVLTNAFAYTVFTSATVAAMLTKALWKIPICNDPLASGTFAISPNNYLASSTWPDPPPLLAMFVESILGPRLTPLSIPCGALPNRKPLRSLLLSGIAIIPLSASIFAWSLTGLDESIDM